MSVGTVIGCLAGGVMCDKFRPHGDLLVLAGSVIVGICIGLVPWWPSLALFYILLTLVGFGTGIVRTGEALCLIRFFKERMFECKLCVSCPLVIILQLHLHSLT